MVAIQIENKNKLMDYLFDKDTFHNFQFIEGTIITNHTMNILGNTLGGNEYLTYSAIQPIFKHVLSNYEPLTGFQIMLQASSGYTEKFIQKSDLQYSAENIKGLLLTIRTDQSGIQCTTSVLRYQFELDKTADSQWDQAIVKSFQAMGMDFALL